MSKTVRERNIRTIHKENNNMNKKYVKISYKRTSPKCTFVTITSKELHTDDPEECTIKCHIDNLLNDTNVWGKSEELSYDLSQANKDKHAEILELHGDKSKEYDNYCREGFLRCDAFFNNDIFKTIYDELKTDSIEGGIDKVEINY